MRKVVLALSIAGALAAACSAFSSEGGSSPSDGGTADALEPVDGATPSLEDGGVDAASALPECTAQRAVYIMAGNAGMAWFTLQWPVPWIVDHYDAAYAYDDPARATQVIGPDGGHELYARNGDGGVLWQGTGTHPMPTALLAGSTMGHSPSPNLLGTASGAEMISSGAGLQLPLGAAITVINFTYAAGWLYGSAVNAPTPLAAASVEGAVSAIDQMHPLSDDEKSSLSAGPALVDAWTGPSAPPATTRLAASLIFAANAFRLGLVATIMMPSFADDPNYAFSGNPAAHADQDFAVLQRFYSELAQHEEPSCSHGGKRVSLADNVVMVIGGDIPKNPFVKNPWSDSTPGGANWIFVRSNGFLIPGWFGIIEPAGAHDYDPMTGATLVGTADGPAHDLPSTQAAVLYAVTRGNTAAVKSITGQDIPGLLATPAP